VLDSLVSGTIAKSTGSEGKGMLFVAQRQPHFLSQGILNSTPQRKRARTQRTESPASLRYLQLHKASGWRLPSRIWFASFWTCRVAH